MCALLIDRRARVLQLGKLSMASLSKLFRGLTALASFSTCDSFVLLPLSSILTYRILQMSRQLQKTVGQLKVLAQVASGRNAL